MKPGNFLAVAVGIVILFSLPLTAENGQGKFPVRIEVKNRAEIGEFIRLGIDISNVRGNWVEAYVSQDEFKLIRDRGFDIVQIPDYAKLMADSLWEATKDSKDPMGAYHTYEELTAELDSIATEYPAICWLENIGQSVQGRELWFMKISDNVNQEENEPEFKYISTMHGDEPVGTELLMYLINYLVDNYGTDPQVTYLVDNTEIWIMPLMNPDGNALHQRYNANGVDLNRDFPDPITDSTNTPEGREPETQAVMNFCFEHSFVSSANFHTGALVVNYPWDCQYPLTPDNDLFIEISLVYSRRNPPMYNSIEFDGGITNGAQWYIIYGGMQDWNYNWLACNEVTIELSNTKWPDASTLPRFWGDNREAMLAYMDQCHRGIRGLVTDATTGQPLAATVSVLEVGKPAYTDPDVGDYHRMLLPGTYTMRVSSNGYRTAIRDSVEVTESITENFQLVPLPVHYYTQSDSLPIPDNDDPVQSYLNVADSIEIEDMNVFVNIRHPYISDLIIKLVSPLGTEVTLHDRSGGLNGDIVGWYDTDIIPDGPGEMGDFIGENVQGQWALWLRDCAGGDVGTLNLWRLEIYGTGTIQGDSVAPAAITDLSVGRIDDTSATLVWTAPGDDGISGRASIYDLRYSLTPVGTDTVGWWNSAEAVYGEPSPSLSGMLDSCTIQSLLSDTTYYFVIKTADEVPNWSGFSNVAMDRTTNVGGLTDFVGLPDHFELFQNYPNPFNPSTTICYHLSAVGGRRTAVRLKIYNILGELVRTLVDEEQVPGYYSIVWDGKDSLGEEVSSGIFFYQLKTGGFVETQKMILLR